MLSVFLVWMVIAIVGAWFMGFDSGRTHERKRRYHPPIGTPGALQEQLHAAMRGER